MNKAIYEVGIIIKREKWREKDEVKCPEKVGQGVI